MTWSHVRLRPSDSLWPARSLVPGGRPAATPWVEVAPDGRFEVDLVEPGVWTLEIGCWRPGVAVSEVASIAPRVVTMLELGAVFSGRQLGEIAMPAIESHRLRLTGEGAGAARVAWRSRAVRWPGPPVHVVGVAEPLPDGTVELLLAEDLDDSRRDVSLVLEVHAPASVPMLLEYTDQRLPSTLELRPAARTVHVRWAVPDVDTDARGQVAQATSVGSVRGLLPWDRQASTVGRGEFLLPLEGGERLLVVRGRRAVEFVLPSPTSDEDAAGEIVVELQGPANTAGRSLVASSDGESTGREQLPGALVWWRHDPATRSVTAADGGLLLAQQRFAPPDGSSAELIAAAAGHRWLGPGPWSSRRELLFQAAVEQRVRVVAAGGEAGDVVAGQPLAGVELVATPKIQIGNFFLLRARSLEDLLPAPAAIVRTDGDGYGTLPGLDPGEQYHLRAQAPGWLVRSTYFAGAVEAAPLELALERGGRYIGWVEDEDGRSVAGAKVTLERSFSQFDMGTMLTDLEEMVPDLRQLETDRDGAFRVDDLRAGAWNLRVDAPGFAPTAAEGLRLPLEEPELLPATSDEPRAVDARPLQALGTLVLGSGRTVTGRVVDQKERAVSGALVEVTWRSGSDVGGSPSRSAISDDEGRFVVGALPATGRLVISARRQGLADAPERSVESAVRSEEEGVVLHMERGRALTFVLIDDLGAPVSGGQVFLRREFQPEVEDSSRELQQDWQAAFPGLLAAQGDVRGVARFETVPLATWTMDVRAKSHLGSGTQRLRIGDEITLLPPEQPEGTPVQPAHELEERAPTLQVQVLTDSEVEVILDRGATLDVTLENVQGEPAPGMMLQVSGREQLMTTDLAGAARFTGLPHSGEVQISVLGTKGILHSEKVEMQGAQHQVSIRLSELRILRGTARGPEGDGVDGARVSVVAPDVVVMTAVTNARGEFEATDLPAVEYQVLVRATGLAPGSASVDLTHDDGEVTLDLETGAEVAGRVVDAWGEPAEGPFEGWQVIAERVDENLHTGNEIEAMMSGVAGGNLMAPVDLDGRFRFTELQPGTRVLTLGVRQGGFVSRPHFVDLVAGEISNVDLVLEPHNTIRGTVVRDGVPVAGVEVGVQSASNSQAVTDADGAFELSGVASGRAVLRAVLVGEASAQQEVDVSGDIEGLWLELTSAVVAGRVTDETTGEPVPAAVVYLRAERRTGSLRRQTDRQGAFSMAASPGTYDVQVVADGYAVDSRKIVLADRDGVELDVQLRAAGEVVLSVKFADGSAPGFVTAWQEVDGHVVQRRCQSSGQDGAGGRVCSVRGVDLATTLWVSQNYNGPAPARLGPERLAAAGGQPIEVTLPVSGGVTVVLRSLLEIGADSGTVTFTDAQTGEPFRRLAGGKLQSEIQVLQPGIRMPTVQLDVPVGAWWVELRSGDGQVFRDLVEVRAEERAVVMP